MFSQECEIFHVGPYGHVRYFRNSIPKDEGEKIIQPVLTNVLHDNVRTIKM